MVVPSGSALRTTTGRQSTRLGYTYGHPSGWESVNGATTFLKQVPRRECTFDKFCCIVRTRDHLVDRLTGILFQKHAANCNTQTDDAAKCWECTTWARRIHSATSTRLCVGCDKLKVKIATQPQSICASFTNCSTRRVGLPIPKCHHV